jgi:ubiquinone biosynthesis protein COQ4
MSHQRPDVDAMRRMGFFGKVVLALKAMSALAKNITDPWGQQAFQWALDSWGVSRVARVARQHTLGRHLLETRPSLALDLDRLATSPEGTLGHFLATWFRAWKLEPFAQRRPARCDVEYFMDRLFYSHDVWHALTGLGTDLRNELRFLSVLLSQYASGSGVMALVVGWLKLPFHDGLRAFISMPFEAWQFYRWGRRSMDLCFIPWEALLDRPIEEVRAMFLADGRPRLGEWQTWPSSRIVVPARFEAEHQPVSDVLETSQA